MMMRAAAFSLRKIALGALRALRPFIKMNAEQSLAWEIVVSLLEGKDKVK